MAASWQIFMFFKLKFIYIFFWGGGGGLRVQIGKYRLQMGQKTVYVFGLARKLAKFLFLVNPLYSL